MHKTTVWCVFIRIHMQRRKETNETKISRRKVFIDVCVSSQSPTNVPKITKEQRKYNEIRLIYNNWSVRNMMYSIPCPRASMSKLNKHIYIYKMNKKKSSPSPSSPSTTPLSTDAKSTEKKIIIIIINTFQ